jgi:septum formation protein
MIDDRCPVLLGSASPRRREIMQTLGLPLRVLPVVVDETHIPEESPLDYLCRVVEAKLAAVAPRDEARAAGAILVADTTVILDGQVLGKPEGFAEARAMLLALSGRSHDVATRFAIAGPVSPTVALHAETVFTTVTFRPLTIAEVEGYAATGEGLDKAGAYAIQGIGSFAVARLDGSYTNVVGLPACEVVAALLRIGLLEGFPRPRSREA